MNKRKLKKLVLQNVDLAKQIHKITPNALVIGANASFEKCDYCGKVDELRPYGKNGANICHDCGMKPENKAETIANMDKLFD